MQPVLKKYEIRSAKIADPFTILMFGDLHGREYGPGNSELLQTARGTEPDLILCVGDLITAGFPDGFGSARSLMRGLSSFAPVCMVNGNHETFSRREPEQYRAFTEGLRSDGVLLLNGRTRSFSICGNPVAVTGYELPSRMYRRFRIPRLSETEIRRAVGSCRTDAYSILLAHNPQFLPVYAAWGADLTLSGHFHGGMVRLPSGRALLSPYGFPLPRYGYGEYHFGEKAAVVTAGLGDHTIPFRICDPFEIVRIRVLPDETDQETRSI